MPWEQKGNGSFHKLGESFRGYYGVSMMRMLVHWGHFWVCLPGQLRNKSGLTGLNRDLAYNDRLTWVCVGTNRDL